MANTIEGRIRTSRVDIFFVTAVAFYLISSNLAESPPWAVTILIIIMFGFAAGIYNNRSRGMIVKYDHHGVRSFVKTIRGKQKEAQVPWHKVYGIEEISRYHEFALIGKDGEVLLTLPANWQGIDDFKAVVLAQLDNNNKGAKQLDFYQPRLKHGILSPGMTAVLGMFLSSLLLTLFFSPRESWVWFEIKMEAIVVGVILCVMAFLYCRRLRSLSIETDKLVLRYPLRNRQLHYDDIASVELVEDPSKPVADKAQRLRINIKGTAKHYHVREFPNRVDVIHQRLNQKLEALS